MKKTPPVAVLHAGAMKTGTTFLQSKLIANRDRLAAHDVHFAGSYWGEQVSAVQDLLGMGRHDPVVAARTAGAWDRFVEETRQSSAGTVMLSMEFLSFANTATARRAVKALEAAGREVHLVLTVRDTARVVPALWQTSITSGGLTTWPRFTAVVRASIRAGGRVGAGLARVGLPTARRFVEVIDVPRMLRTWTNVLPPHHVHVVVVPGVGAPPDRLWHLFSAATGVDPATTVEPPEDVNESLGYASTELVRRVNEKLAVRLPSQHKFVKMELARRGLTQLRHEERRAALDSATFHAALRWNDRIVRVIEESGVTVHGDLTDLPTAAAPDDYGVHDDQAPPTDEELLRSATVGFRTLRKRHQQMTQRRLPPDLAEKHRRQVRQRLVTVRHWADAADPVATALADLVTLCRSMIRVEQLAEEHQQRGKDRGPATRNTRS